MRDIVEYEQEFITHPFERYIEKYRRKIVKQVISDYAQIDNVIVEIGCGMVPLFTDYNDEYSFIVVEPSKYCFINAKKMEQLYKHVICYQGYFEEVLDQIKDRQADIIICSGLLHEVEKPEYLLARIRSLCHENTTVHINVPNAFSLHRLLALEMGIIKDVHQLSQSNKRLQQHTVFDMNNLKELVDRMGYQVIEQGSYFLKPYTNLQMQKCMDLQILNEDILDGLNQLGEIYFKEYSAEIYLNLRLK